MTQKMVLRKHISFSMVTASYALDKMWKLLCGQRDWSCKENMLRGDTIISYIYRILSISLLVLCLAVFVSFLPSLLMFCR